MFDPKKVTSRHLSFSVFAVHLTLLVSLRRNEALCPAKLFSPQIIGTPFYIIEGW